MAWSPLWVGIQGHCISVQVIALALQRASEGLLDTTSSSNNLIPISNSGFNKFQESNIHGFWYLQESLEQIPSQMPRAHYIINPIRIREAYDWSASSATSWASGLAALRALGTTSHKTKACQFVPGLPEANFPCHLSTSKMFLGSQHSLLGCCLRHLKGFEALCFLKKHPKNNNTIWDGVLITPSTFDGSFPLLKQSSKWYFLH